MDRGASSVSLSKVSAAELRISTGSPQSPHIMPVVGIRSSASGKMRQSPLDCRGGRSADRGQGMAEISKVMEDARLVGGGGGVGSGGILGKDGVVAEDASISKPPKYFKSAAGGGGGTFRTCGNGGGSATGSASVSASVSSNSKMSEPSPASHAANILMTPSSAPASGGGTRMTSGSADGRPKTLANDRTMRTPVRNPPEAGASSFLYEASTPLPAMLGSADDDDLSGKAGGSGSISPSIVAGAGAAVNATAGELSPVGPAFAACRTLAADLEDFSTRSIGMRPAEAYVLKRDVFSGGPLAIAEFSSVWRRSRCFSFVLGSRSLQWVEDGRSGKNYRRSWEALTSRVTMAPYTVPSAGESFIPLSRRESEDT